MDGEAAGIAVSNYSEYRRGAILPFVLSVIFITFMIFYKFSGDTTKNILSIFIFLIFIIYIVYLWNKKTPLSIVVYTDSILVNLTVHNKKFPIDGYHIFFDQIYGKSEHGLNVGKPIETITFSKKNGGISYEYRIGKDAKRRLTSLMQSRGIHYSNASEEK